MTPNHVQLDVHDALLIQIAMLVLRAIISKMMPASPAMTLAKHVHLLLPARAAFLVCS